MLTRNGRQRAQLSVFAIIAVALTIAFTSPQFRAMAKKEMVMLSEAQTLQAEAKLAAFKRLMAVTDPTGTRTGQPSRNPKDFLN